MLFIIHHLQSILFLLKSTSSLTTKILLQTPFPFFISKTPSEISIFGTFFSEKKLNFFQFWSIFTENPLFESGHV